MKHLIVILVLSFTLHVSAQDQNNWLTDYNKAIQLSKTHNKPILAFVTDRKKSEALSTLNKYFFNTDTFKTKFAPKVILLKLDILDTKTPNVTRLGIHFTKQTTAPGLALIDKNSRTIFKPLVDMTPENISIFMTMLNDKL